MRCTPTSLTLPSPFPHLIAPCLACQDDGVAGEVGGTVDGDGGAGGATVRNTADSSPAGRAGAGHTLGPSARPAAGKQVCLCLFFCFLHAKEVFGRVDFCRFGGVVVWCVSEKDGWLCCFLFSSGVLAFFFPFFFAV